MPRGGERERALAAEEAQDWGGANATARERGLDRAQDGRLFGKLEWSGSVATSRFVRFGFAEGDLTDFAVEGANGSTPYFARVDVDGFSGAPRATGSVLRALGNETFFAAHANPMGLFSYRVRNAVLNMTFTFADGVNATSESPRSFLVSTPGGAHGHVILTEAATFTLATDGRSANVTLGPHARLLFLHHERGASLSIHALRDAAAADRVGGILTIVGDADGPVQDRVFLSGVTLRAKHAGQGRAEIVASSEAPQPRVVIIHVDPASIGLAEGANVTVTLDGVAVPHGASAGETFNATQPLAHVTRSATAIHVAVAVDHFSDRTIVIAAAEEATPTPTATATSTAATAPPQGSPTPAQGTPLPWALALVAVVLVALLRRR